MNRSHQIRLVPNRKHVEYFRRACGVRRYTYNRVLAYRKEMYEKGTPVNASEAKKWFNSTKRTDCPFVLEVTKCASEQAVADVQKAYDGFFKKRTKYPKFARKGQNERFYIDNVHFRVEGKRILIPKLGWVKMREKLRFNGKIMSAVVSEIAGKWYVSIAVEVSDTCPSAREKNCCGVDLGLTDFATIVDEKGVTKIKGPKALNKAQKKLRGLNKQLSRRKKGSKRRAKTKLALSKTHYRVKCIRQDFLHKLTTKLVKTYTHIGIEDLNVKGMSANHSLARHILDQGWGEWRRQLEYKAEPEGATIVVAPRFYPSSKTCHVCGYVLDKLELSVREWVCPSCSSVHDRDGNAGHNLINSAEGYSVTARGVS